MTRDPLFWFAVAWSLSPIVALRIATGLPLLRDVAMTLLTIALRIVEAFVPRKGGA